MKNSQLHALIRQHLPCISFIDADISDAVEAECTLWQQEDCALIMDFAHPIQDESKVIAALNNIAAQLQTLDQQRETILQQFSQHSKVAAEHVALHYVAFFVENEQDIFCDFALSAPELKNQIAEMSLENGHDIVFNGLENI